MIRRLAPLALAVALSSCTDDSLPPVETMEGGNGVRHTMVSDVKEMCLVPAGEFTMGSDSGGADERPARKVKLAAFYIDKAEVSNGAYARFLDAARTGDHSRCHPSEPKGKDHTPAGWRADLSKDLPVVGVDWFDACAFAAWSDKRLPTEGEWERAARGTDARTYPWGEEWNAEFAGSAEAFSPGLAEVTRFEEGRSQAGCYNLAGNAREWCADEAAGGRAVRGGGFRDGGAGLVSWKRGAADALTRLDDLGFRCALDAK